MIKGALESIGNTADHMKERISELEDRNLEIIQVKEEKDLFLNKRTIQALPDSLERAI